MSPTLESGLKIAQEAIMLATNPNTARCESYRTLVCQEHLAYFNHLLAQEPRLRSLGDVVLYELTYLGVI